MMRGAIATRLTQSMQQIPHFYLTRTLNIDALMAHRARINAALAERPLADGKVEKISLNDLIVRACALALSMCLRSMCLSRAMRFCAITMPISVLP